jgi:hypothetical protein
VFAHFSLPNVPDVARRTVSTVLVVGIAALVACIAFGQPLLGVGACIGLALGILNFRMIGNSVARVSARQDAKTRRPLALNTMGRMGIITVVTIGLLFVSPSLGFGVLGGLAVFQLILLVNVARSMAKAGPMTSVDEVISANVVEDNVVRPDPRPLTGPPDDGQGGG